MKNYLEAFLRGEIRSNTAPDRSTKTNKTGFGGFATSSPARLSEKKDDAQSNPTHQARAARQGEVLRRWTAAHDRVRSACPDWPTGGSETLQRFRPDLAGSIVGTEGKADGLTVAWRDGGGDEAPWLASLDGWVAANHAAGEWLRRSCHACGATDLTTCFVEADGYRRCRRCAS